MTRGGGLVALCRRHGAEGEGGSSRPDQSAAQVRDGAEVGLDAGAQGEVTEGQGEALDGSAALTSNHLGGAATKVEDYGGASKIEGLRGAPVHQSCFLLTAEYADGEGHQREHVVPVVGVPQGSGGEDV